MEDLFDNDPAFKGRKRDSRGRFATAEKALYDRALKENSWLRLQVEKYRRQADLSNGAFIAQVRIIDSQSRIITGLRRELADISRRILRLSSEKGKEVTA